MNSTILKFLGRDSGFGKSNTSAYIENGDEFILIDCGFTVFEILKEKFDFSKYKKITVIITHLHNDHAGSLSQFILYMWFVYNIKVTIISMCENIKRYLEITGTNSEAYEVLEKYNNVEFIKTIHCKTLDCYGFKMNINEKKIIYTGDTMTLDPYLPYINGVSEFYIDVSKFGGVHLKFSEVIDELKKIKSNGTKIILMHIDDLEYITKINNNEFLIAKV